MLNAPEPQAFTSTVDATSTSGRSDVASFLAIVGLGLVVLVCYGIGQGDNAIAALATVVFILGAFALYFSPTAVALHRGHSSGMSLAVLNLLLGWTLVGWVGALAWAYSGKRRGADTAAAAQPTSGQFMASPSSVDARLCPFCAEEIKPQAIKCKHCGSSLQAT